MTQRSEYYVRKFALGLLALAAVGCASNVPRPRDGRAAGEWRFRLPTTQSPYGALAFGRGGSSEPAALRDEQPSLAAAQPVAKHVARPIRAQHSVTALRAVAAQPSATPSESARAPELTTPLREAQPIQLAANDLTPEQRYAERDAQSQKQEQYRGGDAIVIGAGTLVVVLLIVILLILLLR